MFIVVCLAILLVHCITAVPFCPEPGVLYARVNSSSKEHLPDFQPFDGGNVLRLNEGIWFANDVISITFVEYRPRGSHYSTGDFADMHFRMDRLSLNGQIFESMFRCDPHVVKIDDSQFWNSEYSWGGYADYLEPVPSPLCASYIVPFKSTMQARKMLPTIDFDCFDNFDEAEIKLHHLRFPVPCLGSIYEPRLQETELHFKIERHGKSSRNSVVHMHVWPQEELPFREKTYRGTEASAEKELTSVFSFKDGMLHPKFPNKGERLLGITRDPMVLSYTSPPFVGGYALHSSELYLNFHQFRPYTPRLKPGIEISLVKLNGEHNEKHIVTIPDHIVNRECNHTSHVEGEMRQEHDVAFFRHFVNEEPFDGVDDFCSSFGCTNLSNENFDVYLVAYTHARAVSKTFLGVPETMDHIGGPTVSYSMVIVAKESSEELPEGQYAFKITNIQMDVENHNLLNFYGKRSVMTQGFIIRKFQSEGSAVSLSANTYLEDVLPESMADGDTAEGVRALGKALKMLRMSTLEDTVGLADLKLSDLEIARRRYPAKTAFEDSDSDYESDSESDDAQSMTTLGASLKSLAKNRAYDDNYENNEGRSDWWNAEMLSYSPLNVAYYHRMLGNFYDGYWKLNTMDYYEAKDIIQHVPDSDSDTSYSEDDQSEIDIKQEGVYESDGEGHKTIARANSSERFPVSEIEDLLYLDLDNPFK